eukprot:TRINITY_DN9412_c0_g3_i3.p2 TRINITY_DN9412_c0_g3~~TRINITY_DN9412_c0_g3_i3.p2  ORF type:complete len:210 (+),score=21.55 TRINITY_DN9412_c0_g3_i3:582-1211(+)
MGHRRKLLRELRSLAVAGGVKAEVKAEPTHVVTPCEEWATQGARECPIELSPERGDPPASSAPAQPPAPVQPPAPAPAPPAAAPTAAAAAAPPGTTTTTTAAPAPPATHKKAGASSPSPTGKTSRKRKRESASVTSSSPPSAASSSTVSSASAQSAVATTVGANARPQAKKMNRYKCSICGKHGHNLTTCFFYATLCMQPCSAVAKVLR